MASQLSEPSRTTTVRDSHLAGHSNAHLAGSSLQLVSFRLGNETFGVEITNVREIILVGEITRLPETPAYVKGVINLRNTVIPVVDLRTRFGLPAIAANDESRIMVVQLAGRLVGIVVDAVDEVFRVARDQIAPPPETVKGVGREYLSGLVKLDAALLILLDIEHLLNSNDRDAIEAATSRKQSAAAPATSVSGRK
ncbi:MAG: chemotaxis protein CheW [Planctomycetota bacterium]